MTLGTIIDKGGFETGLDAGDSTLVYVAFFLFAKGVFEVQVEKLLAIHKGHPQLFGVGGVDQHSFHHSFLRRSNP